MKTSVHDDARRSNQKPSLYSDIDKKANVNSVDP